MQGLKIVEVAADGHCLFSALVKQLPEHNVMSLRSIAAKYMRNNEEFRCFYTSENEDCTYEVESDNLPKLSDYSSRLSPPALSLEQGFCTGIESGSCWGDALVIQALQNALKISIIVHGEDGLVCLTQANI
jgi:hypothetical protein